MDRTRRLLVATSLIVCGARAHAQRIDNGYRVMQLVRRIEGEYAPRGPKSLENVEAQAIRNPAGIPAAFVVWSSLDRTENLQRGPGPLLVVNFNAVDNYLAGRPNFNLDAFGHLCTFILEPQYHYAVLNEFQRTSNEAARVALLATLRWGRFDATASRVLAQALTDTSRNVRVTALIALAQRRRVDGVQSEYDVPAVLAGVNAMKASYRIAETEVMLTMLLLGEYPFRAVPESAESARDVLRKLPANARRDEAIQHYASRL